MFMDWKKITLLNILLSTVIYRFSEIATKIPLALFTEIEKTILKFV